MCTMYIIPIKPGGKPRSKSSSAPSINKNKDEFNSFGYYMYYLACVTTRCALDWTVTIRQLINARNQNPKILYQDLIRR